MIQFRYFLAILAITGLTEVALGQGKIEWDSTSYPKTGTSSPSGITIKGKITPDVGWTIKETGVIVRVWPKSGGVLRRLFAPQANGTIAENELVAVPPLTSGAEYWVSMEIVMIDGNLNEKRIVSQPKTAKAK